MKAYSIATSNAISREGPSEPSAPLSMSVISPSAPKKPVSAPPPIISASLRPLCGGWERSVDAVFMAVAPSRR